MELFGIQMKSLIADGVMRFDKLRRFAEISVARANGFAYGVYGLADEADLAISLLPRQGGVVIDGGANSGEWSRSLLERGSDRVSVLVMVEPNDFHSRRHRELQERFGTGASEWVALGAEAKELDLFFDTEGSALASLYDRKISHHGLQFTNKKRVSVVTVPEIMSRHNVGSVDFLKLDLEGHEFEALMGAKELLAQHLIKAIQFEFGGANIDSRTYMRDFWGLLHESYGYAMYRILPKRKLRKLDRYSEGLERFEWQNILACAPGVEPGWGVA